MEVRISVVLFLDGLFVQSLVLGLDQLDGRMDALTDSVILRGGERLGQEVELEGGIPFIADDNLAKLPRLTCWKALFG